MIWESPGLHDRHSASMSTRITFTYLYNVAPARLHKFAVALFLGCLSVSEFDVFRRNMLQHNSTASFVILVCFAFQLQARIEFGALIACVVCCVITSFLPSFTDWQPVNFDKIRLHSWSWRLKTFPMKFSVWCRWTFDDFVL